MSLAGAAELAIKELISKGLLEEAVSDCLTAASHEFDKSELVEPGMSFGV